MTKASRGAQLEVARIQSEINRLFDMLLRLREGGSERTGWVPGVDVAETESRLVVEAELPGVPRATLDVWAEGGNLYLKGERPPPAGLDGPGARIIHDEREYGPFEVAIPLSVAVNPRGVSARLDRGVLRLEMPKVTNRRGQAVRIPVEAGRSEE